MFIQITTEKNMNKITYHNTKYNDETILVIIFNGNINNKKKNQVLKTIVFNIIDTITSSDFLYTNLRISCDGEIYLSKKLGIKMRKIDNKTKIMLIVYNYFKVKDLIERHGYEDFYHQYEVAGRNENITNIYKYIENGVIKKVLKIISI